MKAPATMPSSPAISVVVPLYNEEDNVVELQAQIATALTGLDYELVLVDDGSTDATVSRVQRDERVRVLEFAHNAGQSAAMHAGIHQSLGEIIVTLDGDLQNDPADIPAMVAKLQEGFDLVCGYRAKRKDTPFKRLQSRIANGVRSRFIGDHVRDTGCTLKVMRRECREALLLFNGMHRFIPALIRNMDFRVTEMPVNHRPRVHGVSKYGFGNRAWRATCDMFGVRWLNSRRTRYRLKN
ncbi:glycosyltransferase involved in cell wall biosynthesis [Prosthecobacter fusiformis]|uniref:Glycosyltransferase involved in cell wall biosynthesis n=1 Tax=Prosthecobacter fusiformis TaxID=48464 RepID=A0A4R7S7S6_9BACT|nr:glycosyltransferase family 2 protein [Prosthecobacter fusiformis]TDU73277.1 glycosyltransferase involved in cell wall biosynthesis [Prosthecobacter fusiformis]